MVANALASVEPQGDVSLSNIMLSTTGRAVLIDFDSAFQVGEGRYGKMSFGRYGHVKEKVSHFDRRS